MKSQVWEPSHHLLPQENQRAFLKKSLKKKAVLAHQSNQNQDLHQKKNRFLQKERGLNRQFERDQDHLIENIDLARQEDRDLPVGKDQGPLVEEGLLHGTVGQDLAPLGEGPDPL